MTEPTCDPDGVIDCVGELVKVDVPLCVGVPNPVDACVTVRVCVVVMGPEDVGVGVGDGSTMVLIALLATSA